MVMMYFKERFVQPIKSQMKIHTIRQDFKNHVVPGVSIHGYYSDGLQLLPLQTFQCVSTQSIDWVKAENAANLFTMFIDGKPYVRCDVVFSKSFGNIHTCDSMEKLQLISRNSGFHDVYEMVSFLGIETFKGKIIHWTNFKY